MTSTANQWKAVHELVVGDHVHLPELVDNPPSPGSRDWLPILRQLVSHLVEHGGHWGVTLRIGEAPMIPTEVTLTAADVFEWVDATQEYEPPAVYRLSERAGLNKWQGEHHRWARVVEPCVTESITFSRPKNDPPDKGGWFAQITFEVRPAH